MPINVALIGFGLSGRYLQAPFFEANPAYRLCTICTQTSNPQAVYPQVQIARSLAEVLADDTISLVSITTPNATHYAYAVACLEAGKHVLIEKPIASSVSQVEALYHLAKRQNRVLYVYQNRRFDSDFQTVKSVIESGVLGKLLSYEAHFDRYKMALNSKQWKETPSEGSGILFDLGSHLLDQALYLFGTPQSHFGEVWTQRENSTIDDAFDMRLNYGSLKVHLRGSLLVREAGPRYVLHGAKGSFIKYGIDPQEDHLKAGLLPSQTSFGQEDPHQNGLLHTEINGEIVKKTIPTHTGTWKNLFEQLADSILNDAPWLILPEQIVSQISILENIKHTSTP